MAKKRDTLAEKVARGWLELQARGAQPIKHLLKPCLVFLERTAENDDIVQIHQTCPPLQPAQHEGHQPLKWLGPLQRPNGIEVN